MALKSRMKYSNGNNGWPVKVNANLVSLFDSPTVLMPAHYRLHSVDGLTVAAISTNPQLLQRINNATNDHAREVVDDKWDPLLVWSWSLRQNYYHHIALLVIDRQTGLWLMMLMVSMMLLFFRCYRLLRTSILRLENVICGAACSSPNYAAVGFLGSVVVVGGGGPYTIGPSLYPFAFIPNRSTG